jgi:uncharacterized protein (TIGR04255 family)
LARTRPLRDPPITEALIDFRVVLPSQFRVESFAALANRLAGQFPKREEMVLVQTQIMSGSATAPVHVRALRGYRYSSEDGRTFVQLRLDGFTYNRLRPYPGWEAFSSQALDLWTLYTATAAPEAVKRIAVRYINHLSLPTVPDNLSPFLTVPPHLPAEVSGRITGFRERLSLHEPTSGFSAHLSQICEESPEPSRITVRLDIDAFTQRESATPDENPTQVLEALRAFKNSLFFGSITETTAEIYE